MVMQFENQDTILKNRHRPISAAVSAISTKFGRVTQFGPRDRFVRYKFEI